LIISRKKGKGMDRKSPSSEHHHTALDRLFRYAEFLRFGEVHIKFDHATGLKAIIAIHNLKRGPAIGGCRLVQYQTTDDALEDALRLAYMMSLKAAISNLAHGGAKAVLIKPKEIKDRKAYMEAFADIMNALGGRYVTAVDSGTSIADMDIIHQRTPFVTCISSSEDDGDPAPHTAFGVRRGIEAAVKFKLGRDNLEGIHIIIQGVGQVGYHLAKEVYALGARLTVCDVNQMLLDRCVDEFKAAVCSPETVYDVVGDVFAPCALGSILNLNTIERLSVSIIAGSANNQLAHHQHGVILHERGILYAPDFVINAGGLIFAACMYDHSDSLKSNEQVSDIYNIVMDIFVRSKEENRATSQVAETIALEKLR
jgi:leucine dehydrogenase